MAETFFVRFPAEGRRQVPVVTIEIDTDKATVIADMPSDWDWTPERQAALGRVFQEVAKVTTEPRRATLVTTPEHAHPVGQAVVELLRGMVP